MNQKMRTRVRVYAAGLVARVFAGDNNVLPVEGARCRLPRDGAPCLLQLLRETPRDDGVLERVEVGTAWLHHEDESRLAMTCVVGDIRIRIDNRTCTIALPDGAWPAVTTTTHRFCLFPPPQPSGMRLLE